MMRMDARDYVDQLICDMSEADRAAWREHGAETFRRQVTDWAPETSGLTVAGVLSELATRSAVRVGDLVGCSADCEGDDDHTTDDCDHGEVVELDGDQATVVWSGSLHIITQPVGSLRRRP